MRVNHHLKTFVTLCLRGKPNPSRTISVVILINFFFATFSFSQTSEKKILFQGDSIWYAAQNDFLFSSINKGEKWDTIFGKRNPEERFFLNGTLDTATNVFISDSKTIFIFGWDGTMHYKTILYSTSNCGKSWSRNDFNSNDGNVGVKYFHKISSADFFLYLREGFYAISTDNGGSWICRTIGTTSVSGSLTGDHFSRKVYYCFDDFVHLSSNGNLEITCSSSKKCNDRINLSSGDGLIWMQNDN